MHIWTRNLLLAILLAMLTAFSASANTQETRAGGGSAVVLRVDGAIGPATADYLVRGIEDAEEVDRHLVIIEMDTPGGLDSAMRDIIKKILASRVPIAVWVGPEGARAASAGTYILYAAHVAAMAPATNLGAATPVSIGGGGGAPVGGEQEEPAPESEGDGGKEAGKQSAKDESATTAMERKAVNDAVAYIRGLARKRDRNADWAERAVREAVSLSAHAALEENVIDHVAADIPTLLKEIDGRKVQTAAGEVVLQTANLTVEHAEPDWRTNFLSIITDPTVAYLLMLIGIYGLMFEGYSPGAIVPGVVGAICLLLALFAFQVLPVNYAGLALIALGIVLMVAEAFAPSFGALGLGGIAAFIVGSVILMDTDVPGFGIPTGLIIGVSGIGGAITLGIIWFAISSKQRTVVSGSEQLIGATAVAKKDFTGRGMVHVLGENWIAESREPVRKGQEVRVTRRDGLVLQVEPINETSTEETS